MRTLKEDSTSNFRIRLEARLKNDMLIEAREKSGLSQKTVAAVIGISPYRYGQIERMQFYPSEELQEKIINFYRSYNFELNSDEVFPSQLKKAKFDKKYSVTREINSDRLLPISSIDRQLLLPAEIDDGNIRNEDLNRVIEISLRSLPRINARAQMSDVIKMYFGLPPYEKNYNEAEIAKKYNLSKTRIGQIKNLALRRLRHTKRSKDLKSFL